MAGTRAESMATALDVADLYGGARAALEARGVSDLGDDVTACQIARFLDRTDDGCAALAECIALGFLWRDLAGDRVAGAG